MLDQMKYVQENMGNFFKFEYYDTMAYKDVNNILEY